MFLRALCIVIFCSLFLSSALELRAQVVEPVIMTSTTASSTVPDDWQQFQNNLEQAQQKLQSIKDGRLTRTWSFFRFDQPLWWALMIALTMMFGWLWYLRQRFSRTLPLVEPSGKKASSKKTKVSAETTIGTSQVSSKLAISKPRHIKVRKISTK